MPLNSEVLQHSVMRYHLATDLPLSVAMALGSEPMLWMYMAAMVVPVLVKGSVGKSCSIFCEFESPWVTRVSSL